MLVKQSGCFTQSSSVLPSHSLQDSWVGGNSMKSMKAGVIQTSDLWGKRGMGILSSVSGGFLPLLSVSTTFRTHSWDVNSVPSVA